LVEVAFFDGEGWTIYRRGFFLMWKNLFGVGLLVEVVFFDGEGWTIYRRGCRSSYYYA
jgi:hypothetical protein